MTEVFRKLVPKGALLPEPAAPPSSPSEITSASEAFELARKHNDALRPNEAIALFRRALELQSGHGAAARELGLTLFDAGRSDEAVTFFHGFIEVNAKDQETRLAYASVLIRASDLERAEQQLVECIERDPRWAPPYVPLIRLLWRGGRKSEARERLHTYRALLPDPRTVEMLESMMRSFR